ncbi:MAG: ribonuclease P protein component [Patescibacteria group bacterium]
MIPKGQRVKRALFPGVLKSGKAFFSERLTLRVSSGDSGKNKFSFVTPKTVSKKAVERNLLRRRGYAAVSKINNRINPGHIFIFSFKKGTGIVPYKEIEEDVVFLIKKAGLFKG